MSNKEGKCIEIIKTKLKEGMIAIDVGASIGRYTVILSQLVGTNGKVYAIEPLPDNMDKLIAVVNKQGLSNVRLIESAISNKTDMVTILQHHTLTGMGHLECAHNDKSTRSSRSINMYDKLIAPCYTFNDFQCRYGIDNVDFIKIDIEGGEVFIFDGMDQVMKQDKLIIYIELHFEFMQDPYSQVKHIIDTLTSNNFIVTYLIDKNNNIHDINRMEDIFNHVEKGIVYLFFEK